MIKIIESKKLEAYLVALVIIFTGLTFLNAPYNKAPLAVLGLVVILFYLIRMIVSFRHWELSKGISVINAFLNFQILICFQAAVFTFLDCPGRYLLVYQAVTGTRIFIIIIGIFLVIRWTKINRAIYWEYLKANAFKALIGILLCLILMYAYGMPSHLYGPSL